VPSKVERLIWLPIFGQKTIFVPKVKILTYPTSYEDQSAFEGLLHLLNTLKDMKTIQDKDFAYFIGSFPIFLCQLLIFYFK
jgi:hypothetical protein